MLIKRYKLKNKKMPIGVPRIIYCWGEELPAQWTDIYNFIFRRRMVFLMQYLDDELCNQICGLLINIHMEDRSKEMEKKEIERSGVFKSSVKTSSTKTSQGSQLPTDSNTRSNLNINVQKEENFYNKKSRSMEDLLNVDEDLGIDDIDKLEQHTLQKITSEWLNWNAQFFDYSDEPYLYYLADLLSKDFNKNQMSQRINENSEISQLLNMLKNKKNINNSNVPGEPPSENQGVIQMGEIYSPFRTNANFSSLVLNDDLKNQMLNKQNFFLGDKTAKKQKLLQMFQNYQNITKTDLHQKKPISSGTKFNFSSSFVPSRLQKGGIVDDFNTKKYSNLLGNLAQKEFSSKIVSSKYITESSEGILGQRNLRREYNLEKNFSSITRKFNKKIEGYNIKDFNYLKSSVFSSSDFSQTKDNEFRDYYRKQTERALMEEESKKVFVIINSFGGSVGNGITVHDALQFIKAGSLTLALGVAASAASLALAGGTIGERYVTEGCHVMIHQPESGLQGQASDIWIDSQEIMKIRLDVAEIYSLSTYRPRHKILRDLDRDFYLTATETIQYGLADEIATNEVMSQIMDLTNKVWDYHDSQQERLLDSRVRNMGDSAQTQESS
jgi:ATP-dependent Clp protease, protease subunit